MSDLAITEQMRHTLATYQTHSPLPLSLSPSLCLSVCMCEWQLAIDTQRYTQRYKQTYRRTHSSQTGDESYTILRQITQTRGCWDFPNSFCSWNYRAPAPPYPYFQKILKL